MLPHMTLIVYEDVSPKDHRRVCVPAGLVAWDNSKMALSVHTSWLDIQTSGVFIR